MKITAFWTLFLLAAASCGTVDAGPSKAAPEPVRPLIHGDDAIILALRDQAEIALDSRLVKQFDHLLRVARAANPAVLAGIHARSRFTLNTIELRAAGRVAAAFDRDVLRTGIDALDALFVQYQLTGVRAHLQAPSRDSATVPPRTYELLFREPIRTSRLVDAVKALRIADISDAYPDGMIGDGDDIAGSGNPVRGYLRRGNPVRGYLRRAVAGRHSRPEVNREIISLLLTRSRSDAKLAHQRAYRPAQIRHDDWIRHRCGRRRP